MDRRTPHLPCLLLASTLLACLPTALYATNGMNLEGYGPIAMGMGGGAMAYDNGTAAVINNPATLGLMAEGRRADLALGLLGPDIDTSVPNQPAAHSSGEAYYMPAFGWATHRDRLSYGFGVFGQGGMGTQYGSGTWLADPSQGANTALTEGLVNLSEVSVGRLMIPLTYAVNDRLTVGGTIDLVWAGMDLKMAMSKAQFEDMANPASQTIGTASGTLVQGFGAMYEPFGGSGIATLHHAYFDFSNTSPFSGSAQGRGLAAKLGAVYRVNEALAVGATYHGKTALDDLESHGATLSMAVNANFGSGYQDYDIPVTGDISVRDFEWPAIYGAGLAYQASDRLLVVADIKRIAWSDVMRTFKMRFTADASQANPLAGGFAGAQMDAALFQDWEDQTVVMAGLAYGYDDRTTLRAGVNVADNPVPNRYVNALFPAIIEEHYTLGIGRQTGDRGELNFALSIAPSVTVTNPGNGGTIPPVTTRHSQLSWQVMYSHYY